MSVELVLTNLPIVLRLEWVWNECARASYDDAIKATAYRRRADFISC